MNNRTIQSIALASLLLGGCATGPSRNPVPPELSGNTRPIGYEDVRISMNPYSHDWSELDRSLAGAAQRAADKAEPLSLLCGLRNADLRGTGERARPKS